MSLLFGVFESLTRRVFCCTKWLTQSVAISGMGNRQPFDPGIGYLTFFFRDRPDTIRCIVASLVGDGESGDSLVDDNEPIQPLQQQQEEDYSDPNWEPEPIDAGPGASLMSFQYKLL